MGNKPPAENGQRPPLYGIQERGRGYLRWPAFPPVEGIENASQNVDYLRRANNNNENTKLKHTLTTKTCKSKWLTPRPEGQLGLRVHRGWTRAKLRARPRGLQVHLLEVRRDQLM